MYDLKQSAIEVARHVLFRSGLDGAINLRRQRRGKFTGHLFQRDMAEIFSRIYANGVWINQDYRESLSGVGSAQVATSELVVRLSAYLRDVGCRRLVDIGCGDFNWMRNVEGDFEYVGIDVVPQVIDANTSIYANDRRRFICMDAIRGEIPRGDIAICREVLFHLSFRDGLQMLRNIKTAGFKYVLLTSNSNIWFNSDIRNGDFRPINLAKPPFRLAPPLLDLEDDKASKLKLTDDRTANGRVLSVWPGSALPDRSISR
jgi:SAM-dependent methyltransferase